MKNWITAIKNKFFASKPKKKKVYQPPWWSECWTFLNQQPIGTTFDYLGTKMVITGFNSDFHGLCFKGEAMPSVNCEYMDKNGKLHEWVFTTSMLPMLQSILLNKTPA